MAAPKLLRDRTLLTRLLILREFLQRPQAPLRDVASVLDVTPQAVSAHVAVLARQGLLEGDRGQRTVTPAGVQRLQEGFRELKLTVDTILEPLGVVASTSAVARTPIRSGERVGLFMEEGVLVARGGRSSASTGRAQDTAAPGQEVILTELSGLVDLEPGNLWIVRLPGPDEGGSSRVNGGRLRTFLDKRGIRPARVGVEGISARVAVAHLGWQVEFAFAATRASFHAAQLGLDVALFVSEDRWRDALEVVNGLNQDALHRVPVQILEAPLEPRSARRT